MNNDNMVINSDEWIADKLGNICDYFNGGSHEEFVTYDGDFNLISLNSIDIEGNLKDSNKKVSYTDNSLKKDDIVMVLSDVAHGNFLGLSAIIPSDNYVLNQRMAGLRIKNKENFSPQYLRYYINHNQKYFKSKGQGSSQLNLSKNAVTDFKIYYPKNNKIQQKIAACLSSLDDVIAGHEEKLTALEEHKKGLMQNLFPQEGETKPKYRFPEFENDGDWVEKKLGEVAILTSSKRVHLADYVPEGIPFFRGKEITELKYNTMPKDLLYISKEQYEIIKSKYGIPSIGDILITAVGTLGNTLLIDKEFKFYFKDGNLIWLKNIIEDSSFLELLLNVRKDRVHESAIGSSQKALTMEALRKLEFLFPPTQSEQQKIASVLSSVDELIVAQREKIEALKEHKKGLMQGLFPKLEA